MRKSLAIVFWLLGCIAAQAFPQCANILSQSYWILTDDNPTTNVWDVANGASIANSSAAYQAWLAGINPCPVAGVTNAADNGSGAIRLTVNSTASLQTGQYWTLYGTETAADAVYQITVISGDTVDLVGSTYSDVFTTGVLYGSRVATTASLLSTIDSANANSWQSTTVSNPSSAADITVANPLPSLMVVTLTTTGKKLILPAMNVLGAPPIGKQFVIMGNTGTEIFNVYKNDGSTLIAFAVRANDHFTFVLTDNSTANGNIVATSYSFASPFRVGVGGTGVANGYPIILGSPVTTVDLNASATDNAVVITSPTTNYIVDRVLVRNKGTTASLTTATVGLFTSTGGGGIALAADQSLSAITANAIGTDANSLALVQTAASRTAISSGTLQFRVGTAQGAAATADVYVWIRPLP